jgi:hypothetical protein
MTLAERKLRREQVAQAIAAGATFEEAREQFGLSLYFIREIAIRHRLYVPKTYQNCPADQVSDNGDGTASITLKGNLKATIDVIDLPLVQPYAWYHAKRNHRSQYVVGCFKGASSPKIPLHRLITNAAPGQAVDHADCDTLNNRRANLRFCTARENSMNRPANSNNQSGFKGVSLNKHTNRWVAKVSREFIGAYRSSAEAARAYDAAVIKRFGEFAHTNFPRENYAVVLDLIRDTKLTRAV